MSEQIIREAEALKSKGDIKGALELLERSFSQQQAGETEESWKQLQLMLSLYNVSGELDKAFKLGQKVEKKAMSQPGGFDFLAYWAVSLAMSGRKSQSDRIMSKLSSHPHMNPLLFKYQKAMISLLRGNPASALEQLEEMRSMGNIPEHMQEILTFNTGVCLCMDGQLHRAAETARELDSLPEMHPLSSSYRLYLKALMHLISGQLSVALDYYNRALQISRGQESLINVGEILKDIAYITLLNHDPNLAGVYTDAAAFTAQTTNNLALSLEVEFLRGLIYDRNPGYFQQLVNRSEKAGMAVQELVARCGLASKLLCKPAEKQGRAQLERARELAEQKGLRGMFSLMTRLMPELGDITSVPTRRPSISSVNMRLLGDIVVERGPKKVRLKGKLGYLLAYMATHKNLSKERVISVFWGDKPPDRGLRNYYAALSNIKSVLRRELDVDFGKTRPKFEARINLAISTDAAEIEGLIKAGRALEHSTRKQEAVSLYKRATELYAGEFLPGCNMVWAQDHRDRLRSMFVEACCSVGEHELKQQPENALSWAEKALFHDPLCERACSLKIRSLIVLGRTIEARRFFQRFSKEFLALTGSESWVRFPENSPS